MPNVMEAPVLGSKPGRMQANVFQRPGKFGLEDVAIPTAGPGEASGWRLGNSSNGVQAQYARIPFAQANLAVIPDEFIRRTSGFTGRHCFYRIFSSGEW